MTGFGRLSADFIARVEAHPNGWPKRSPFVSWYRDVKGYHGSVEHSWPDLKAGKPAPHQVVVGFLEYMKERRGLEGVMLSAGTDGDGVWRSLRTVVHFGTEHYADDKDMYFTHPFRDPVETAEMTAASVGRKVGAPPGEELSVGQREMGIDLENLSRWFSKMWRAEFRTVMFAVVKGRRVGASVMLPLKEKTFHALCSGQLGCWEIGPDDLESPSKYLFLTILAEPSLPDGISVKESSGAQVRCLFYQGAYFSRRTRHPLFLTFAANPQYADRLHRHGYRGTGVNLKGTDKPLVMLRHPSEIDGVTQRDWFSYRLMMVMIRMYQTANSRLWKREDRQ